MIMFAIAALVVVTPLTMVSQATSDSSIGQVIFDEGDGDTVWAEAYSEGGTIDSILLAGTDVAVTGVTVNKSSVNLAIGDTTTLTATVLPADATDKSVKWSSSNKAVATIDGNGLVTAISVGQVTVTVTTNDGNFRAFCTVKVMASALQPTGVILDKSTMSLQLYGSGQLTATVFPSDAANKNVVWASSNKTVANVDSTGKVLGITIGTATITATTADGSFTASCEVTVVSPVKGVTLDPTSMTINLYGTGKLTATISPANATNKEVRWTSSNKTIVNVDATGKLTGISVGTATITVTTVEGGKTATCIVTVVIPVTGVKVDKDEMTLECISNYRIGEGKQLTATVSPSNATYKSVTWDSNNKSVATVDNSGLVTAVGGGTATITATTKDGGFTATCLVTVIDIFIIGPIISIDPPSMTLKVGETGVFTVSVTLDWMDKTVIFSSSNKRVVNVDAAGKVTGITPGMAMVRITTSDGNLTTFCAVTVLDPSPAVPVECVKINEEEATLMLNCVNTWQLTATVFPHDATDKSVTWITNDPDVATVDSNGLVTAVGVGEARVLVFTNDGNFVAMCTVTVTPCLCEGFIYITLAVGETWQIVAPCPPGATNKNLKWSLDNRMIVNIDATGKVIGISLGTATITVTVVDCGCTAKYVVTVLVPVIDVKVDKDEVTLEYIYRFGERKQLTATVLPLNATNKSVEWSSSDESVATVDNSGLVTAVGDGTATITVTTNDGGFTDTCFVTVIEMISISPILEIDENEMTLTVGSTGQLTVSVFLPNWIDKDVTWSSSNTMVATVDATGKVLGITTGTATITVTTAEGSFTASCEVTVVSPIKGVTLDPTSMTINLYGMGKLTATISPANATNKDVTWSSNKPDVATVDNNGLVTAVGVGETRITVTTNDGGFTAVCFVTVGPTCPGPSVTLDKDTVTLAVGETEQLIATVLPIGAADVRWFSSNPSVVTVDSNGLVAAVTALTSGTAIISVETVDGGFTAACEVTVVTDCPVYANGIVLDRNMMILPLGETEQIMATVFPANANDKSVTWSSNKPDLATVDNNGLVTAVGIGEAVVTVMTNNCGYTAMCIVTVVTTCLCEDVVYEVTLVAGGTWQTMVPCPPGTTHNFVTWSSSNTMVAIVDATGKVIGIAPGTATIVMTVDCGCVATYVVTVVVPVTGVEVDINKMTLEYITNYSFGEKKQITATVLPEDATDKSVTWTSTDRSVAIVDNNGLVNAVGGGTATITVTTNDGGFTAECFVTVIGVVLIGPILWVDPPSMTLKVGETGVLTAYVARDGIGKNFSWSSSNDAVATVDHNGRVTAVGAGTATITVTTNDGGYTAACGVTVISPPVPMTGAEVDMKEIILEVGDYWWLTATVFPANETR